MKCENCGNEISANDTFCAYCGQPVMASKQREKMFCGNCGAEIDEGDDFCSECGAPIHDVSSNPENDAFCWNCGAKISSDESICHNCGQSLCSNDNDTERKRNKKFKSYMALIVVAAFIVAAASAGVIWHIVSNNSKYDNIAEEDTNKVTQNSTETVVPTANVEITAAPTVSPDIKENESQAQIYDNVQLATYYVVNCDDYISLRESPSTTSKVLKKIPLGDPVSYVEPVKNGFAKIIYNGTTGYALQSYLSLTQPQSSRANNTVNSKQSNTTQSNTANNKASGNSVVSNPTYATYTDKDYNFSCSYPTHFQVYNENNSFMRYTLKAADNTATLKICATKNSSNLSVQTVLDNFKSTYPGNVDYENSGDYWCVASTAKDGTAHYAYFNLKNGMIRGFEFHCDEKYIDIYDKYINDIYDSLKFN